MQLLSLIERAILFKNSYLQTSPNTNFLKQNISKQKLIFKHMFNHHPLSNCSWFSFIQYPSSSLQPQSTSQKMPRPRHVTPPVPCKALFPPWIWLPKSRHQWPSRSTETRTQMLLENVRILPKHVKRIFWCCQKKHVVLGCWMLQYLVCFLFGLDGAVGTYNLVCA